MFVIAITSGLFGIFFFIFGILDFGEQRKITTFVKKSFLFGFICFIISGIAFFFSHKFATRSYTKITSTWKGRCLYFHYKKCVALPLGGPDRCTVIDEKVTCVSIPEFPGLPKPDRIE